MLETDPRHGTSAGYDAHIRAGQSACASCRAAAAAYEARRQLERSRDYYRLRPARGVARRIQALMAIGYTAGVIGEALGVGHDLPMKWAREQTINAHASTVERVAELYSRWSMTPAPETTGRDAWRASYARTVAAKHGWAPPLAWDDIDLDDAPSAPAPDEDDVIDPVVVDRILSGRAVPAANNAERREAVARWHALGRPLKELERITGWRTHRYLTNPDLQEAS